MADATNISTMQLLSAQNQPNSDSEDASAAGTYGVRPEFQQIQASLRGVSLDDGWETINGLLNVAWTGGLAPTYIDPNNFSYQGNQTNYFTVNRRVKAIVNAGNIYGTISTSSYSSGPNTTTVTVTWDSTTLDPTVSDVQISALNPAFNSIPVIAPATLPPQVETSLTTPLAAVTSGTNTYTATLSPVPISYIVNQHYWMVFSNMNTGPSTLNLNGLGAINIVKNANAPLVGSEIAAGQALELFYDGTNFQIIGPLSLDQTKVYKSSIQSVTSSTVLVNDNALAFNVAVNETWQFTFNLWVTTGSNATNGGLSSAIVIPAGTNIAWTGSNNNGQAQTTSGVPLTIINNGSPIVTWIIQITGIATCGINSGPIQLQWAQQSSTATATTINVGSNLFAIRVNP